MYSPLSESSHHTDRRRSPDSDVSFEPEESVPHTLVHASDAHQVVVDSATGTPSSFRGKFLRTRRKHTLCLLRVTLNWVIRGRSTTGGGKGGENAYTAGVGVAVAARRMADVAAAGVRSAIPILFVWHLYEYAVFE